MTKSSGAEPGTWKRWPVLPHELFFGVFMALTWARLIAAEGLAGVDAWLYFALIAGSVGTILFCPDAGPNWRWRLRLGFYPVAMNVIYFNLGQAVPRIASGRMDHALAHIDTLLIGGNLSVRLQPWVHPGLTEFFSGCYLLFFPYLLVSMVYYFAGELRLLKACFIGLFTIYGLGFLGYSLVPAAGPCFAFAGLFHVPLEGWSLTHWNAAVVARGSNGVDVFPSLHCAISSFLLFFDFQHRRWRFWLYLVPCVGLWGSTLYLRYHYLIDVLCGFGLSGFALWLSRRRLAGTAGAGREEHTQPAANSILQTP